MRNGQFFPLQSVGSSPIVPRSSRVGSIEKSSTSTSVDQTTLVQTKLSIQTRVDQTGLDQLLSSLGWEKKDEQYWYHWCYQYYQHWQYYWHQYYQHCYCYTASSKILVKMLVIPSISQTILEIHRKSVKIIDKSRQFTRSLGNLKKSRREGQK